MKSSAYVYVCCYHLRPSLEHVSTHRRAGVLAPFCPSFSCAILGFSFYFCETRAFFSFNNGNYSNLQKFRLVNFCKLEQFPLLLLLIFAKFADR